MVTIGGKALSALSLVGIDGMRELSQKYDCGDHWNVDAIAEIRLWALSDSGDYRIVATIGGKALAALSLVDTIGMWALSRKYNCRDHWNMDTIAEMRLWALSNSGHYQIGSARTG